MVQPRDREYFNPDNPALGHCTSICGHRNSLTVDKLRQLSEAGCEYIELSALQQLHLDMFDESRIEQLAKTLWELELKCWSIHAPFCGLAMDDPDTRADAARLLELSCHRARQFGCGIVVVHPGRDIPSEDADRELQWMREGLARVAAGVEGVTLAVETMSESSQRMLDIIDGIDGVGICLDSGHVHQNHDLYQYVKAIAGKIVTVHLHDNNGSRDEHNPPGMGTIDWDEFMVALHKSGYDGVLVSEGSASGIELNEAVSYFHDYLLNACRSIP